MAEDLRCAGCGEVFKDGEESICITEGKIKKHVHKQGRVWGVLHRPCFNRAMDSPATTMEEVRRLSDGVD